MHLLRIIKRWFQKVPQVDNTMKYLIIGLGNMGPEYENTRHNIGFDVVDELANQQGCPFKSETLGDLAEFKYRGRTVYLLKPSTYMNLSGKAIRYWVQKLNINHLKWLVVVDEFQFDMGVIKLQKKGSPGGHNGLKSVENMMQSSTYPRLRVGIGHEFHRGGQVDYVLGHWSDVQLKLLPEIKKTAADIILSFVGVGLERAMSEYNGKTQ